MSVIYKTLFEVKLMHEYFLTDKEGSVVFEEPGQAQRLAFLRRDFSEGKDSVDNDIGFEFPKGLKSKYEGLFLKLLPSYSGCRVVVRVSPLTLADQSIVYRLFVPFPEDLTIFISLTRKNNNSINSYTNERIKRACPSIYFFSNLDVITPRAFPFLTNNIPSENSLAEYEHGELSLSSSNIIREFFRQGGTDQWNDVKGTGFANESDRLLLPDKFEYNFGNTADLTQAEFVLKDSNGTQVLNITKENSSGIGPKLFLDFSDKVNFLPPDKTFLPASFIYTLEVTGNNGYTGRHNIIFSNELSVANPWAVLNIRTTATDVAFNLFAPDEFLIRRRDAFGIWTPAPVFEIPVKSRLAYWRFINDKGKELDVSPALTDYINKEGSLLVTKRPRSLAKDWFLLRKEAPAGTVYVPNPVSYELFLEEDRRAFYNIRVPQSVLFPATV